MSTATVPATASARLLLVAGVVMGPLFVVTSAVQATARDGFDLSHQPLSLLSLDDLGWIQIANFVVAGLLSLAFARGVTLTIGSGPGDTWAPRLLAIHGIGYLVAGVFLPDPALGYPPGTPDEIPDTMSAHGVIHAVGPVVAFLALVAACWVIARRFTSQGRRRAAMTTRLVGVLCLVLSVPGGDGAALRLFVASTLGFAWITAFALDLITAGDRTKPASTPRHLGRSR